MNNIKMKLGTRNKIVYEEIPTIELPTFDLLFGIKYHNFVGRRSDTQLQVVC